MSALIREYHKLKYNYQRILGAALCTSNTQFEIFNQLNSLIIRRSVEVGTD